MYNKRRCFKIKLQSKNPIKVMYSTPYPGQNQEGYFFMKYDWKFKLECVRKYKSEHIINCPAGINRDSFSNQVRNWVSIFDKLGIEGLKHKTFNKVWTPEEKLELVSEVIAGKSYGEVARQASINNGQLYNWVQIYREKGFDGLKCSKRGRPPKNPIMTKPTKTKASKLKPSELEELKLLRKKTLYLEAENFYLKKLRALELEKQAKLTKAKKQD